MPKPNMFKGVESDQALLSYGPEFIDLNKPVDSSHVEEIQAYLRKIKAIEKDFPADLDLDCKWDHRNYDLLEKYNDWLQRDKSIVFKDEFNGDADLLFSQSDNQTTYRKAYVEYLKTNFDMLNNSSENVQDIELKSFFDKAPPMSVNGEELLGWEIYQKALKEEMGSTPFKRATFFESLKIYRTDADVSIKPVFCLLGPSGSGKSYSGDAFFKQLFPEGTKNELMVFSADNAIPRSQSKILALTKQVLESRRYRVKDLDFGSKKHYQDFKRNLRQFILDIKSTNPHQQFGLFIPETLASKMPISPLHFFKSTDSEAARFLEYLNLSPSHLDNVNFYAGKIQHENTDIFSGIVKIMAERRAYPRSVSIEKAQDNPKPFTFYPENLKEYKKYSAIDFVYNLTGLNTSFIPGMTMAEKVINIWQSSSFPIKTVNVKNDLILVRKKGDDWQECSEEEVFEFSKRQKKQPDNDYQVVSERVFENWKSINPRPDFMVYLKNNRLPPEIEVIDKESPSLKLVKHQRYIPQPINQACIDAISKKGLLELAFMCLYVDEFQKKFPKLYNEVSGDEDILRQMLSQIDANHPFLKKGSKADILKSKFQETVQDDEPLERVLDFIKLGG